MWGDTRSESDPLRRRLRRLSPAERKEEAVEFIRRFHRENQLPDAQCRARLKTVRRRLATNGYYEHTAEELAYGARLAWRNHSRCIGRLLWQSLEVIDCRSVRDVNSVGSAIISHMTQAFDASGPRSIISIFPPVRGGEAPAYVDTPQLIQYAGHLMPDGTVLGDRANVERTRTALALGWSAPETRGPFDILPMVLRDEQGRSLLLPLPDGLVREVPIHHPDLPGISALGLRWYALPFVSDMILTIGGIDYPCAPFNGFYMGTEIASRNFADERRYDLLPQVADAIGSGRDDTFWKDRALLELNRAVLHSFQKAGVPIVDHHMASEQFMEFMRRETVAGRALSADWAWIVPPQASPACPVFHVDMQERSMVPNFYRARAIDGADLRPSYEDENDNSRLKDRWRRLKRRYYNWQRELN